MKKQELIRWMIICVSDYPISRSSAPELPSDNWDWFWLDNNLVALDWSTGDYINIDDFYEYRHETRLVPCEMGFKQLIESINCD